METTEYGHILKITIAPQIAMQGMKSGSGLTIWGIIPFGWRPAASGKIYESGFVFQRGPFSRGRRSTPGEGAGRIGGDPTGG